MQEKQQNFIFETDCTLNVPCTLFKLQWKSYFFTNPGCGLKTTVDGRATMPHENPTFVPAWPTHGPTLATGTNTAQQTVVSQPSSGQHLSTFFWLVLLCFSCFPCIYLCNRRSIIRYTTFTLSLSFPPRHLNSFAWGLLMSWILKSEWGGAFRALPPFNYPKIIDFAKAFDFSWDLNHAKTIDYAKACNYAKAFDCGKLIQNGLHCNPKDLKSWVSPNIMKTNVAIIFLLIWFGLIMIKCWSKIMFLMYASLRTWSVTLTQTVRYRERGPLKSWRSETMAEAIWAVLQEGLSLSQVV